MCKSPTKMHCNLDEKSVDNDGKPAVTFSNWCSEGKDNKKTRDDKDAKKNEYEVTEAPELPAYDEWKVDMSGKATKSKCDNADWSLSYENAGAHMHFQQATVDPYNVPDGRVYARCSASRKFKSNTPAAAKSDDFDKNQGLSMDTDKLTGVSTLWVRGGMNVYDSDKKMVDQRSTDW